jgi:hypothetical protein
MPNQLNYPDPLPDELVNTRPLRLAQVDVNLFDAGVKEVLFGITPQDVVEVWMYYPDGALAGGITLDVTDTALKLSTIVDNTGAYEFLNIDFGDIARRLEIEQGRYSAVINIFRNEIGSETTDKLYIETISSDRTELRLYPSTVSNTILNQIYEFIEPSVPKIIAQGLISQVFGKNIDVVDAEKTDPIKVKNKLDLFIEDTTNRLVYSDSLNSYQQLVNTVIERAYQKTLDNMSLDVQNRNIQAYDLEQYITSAIQSTVAQMKQNNEIDNRFEAF